jgi:excisionase family DNA binding protein
LKNIPFGAITLAEMAERYRVSKKTLLREIQRGNLEAMMVGNTYRVTPDQARAWEERKTGGDLEDAMTSGQQR